MDKYMSAADLMVGKAGGSTTSECPARAWPMAFQRTHPRPGGTRTRTICSKPERRFARTICPQRPGRLLLYWTTRLVFDRLPEAASKLGKPAAAAVAEDALRLLD